jgi:hypothetical protein
MTKTAQSKVVAALNKGRKLTVAQIRAMGLSNPHDAIYKIRRSVDVTSETKVTRNGSTTVYSL